MRARAKKKVAPNRAAARAITEKSGHQADVDVVERFERPPYWPVMKFKESGKKK